MVDSLGPSRSATERPPRIVTLEFVLGQPAVFRLSEDSGVPADLTDRERRLLVGALNFHALMAPGCALEVNAYSAATDSLPRLTDDATFDGLSVTFRDRDRTIGIESRIAPEDREPIPAESPSLALTSGETRHIHISSDSVLEFDPVRPLPAGAARRALRALRARRPLVYNEIRDLAQARDRRALGDALPRRNYGSEFRLGGPHADSEIILAPAAPEGAPRAVILGLHWFELGGAERWAFESVRVVRDAGLLPIVLTNRDSQHPWITRSELDGAVLIPFSEPTIGSQTAGVEELLRGILRTFDVRGVVVHHNQWLYDRLHWIAASRPGIPMIDSTHIVEYRGGGYPSSSVVVDEVITKHHVISPSLERWMVDVHGVSPDKVVMAPLGGLTVSPQDAALRPRREGEPFTALFVGRMASQKAPEVFVEMIRRLAHRGADFRFIMHGDGELALWVDGLIAASGAADRVIRRDSSVPVKDSLDEADVLVVTSQNEGLTLTTLEAVSHGVPVISTDVGAQSDILPSEALVSRSAHRAARQLAEKIQELDAHEDLRASLWRAEREAEQRLLSHVPATEWLEKEVRTW